MTMIIIITISFKSIFFVLAGSTLIDECFLDTFKKKKNLNTDVILFSFFSLCPVPLNHADNSLRCTNRQRIGNAT